MSDIEKRINKIRREIDDAKSKKTRQEVQKEQMEVDKNKLLAGFKELDVNPKKAKEELEKLEADIEGWLVESEKVIEDYNQNA